MTESTLGRAYRVLYEKLCGSHPNLMPWHSQWLVAHRLNRDLAAYLPKLAGRVLDVGCGQQPYRRLLRSADEYLGADAAPGGAVDVVISPGSPWPLPDEHVDVVLMTQVIEYLEDIHAVVAEMRRVLRPDGIAIVTFPFLFNEHGANDLLRLSANAVGPIFVGFTPVNVEREGGIGSTIGTLFLNWLNQSLNGIRPLRLLRPLFLPVWLPLCLVVNLLSLCIDWFDRTACYYTNVFAMLRKDGSGSITVRELA